MTVKGFCKISERRPRVLDNKASRARILLLAFGNDYRSPFFDCLTDEFMTIGFLAPQRHEHAIPLHSPRVIRDIFHRAIKCPDDLANWSRGEKSLELHEALTCPQWDGFAAANHGEVFNGATHWLRRFVPPVWPCEFALPALFFRLALRESLCESPHAAQDLDSGPPSPLLGKKLVLQSVRRNLAPVWWCARHRARLGRQTRGGPPVDSRRMKQHTSPARIRLWDQPSVRFRFYLQS